METELFRGANLKIKWANQHISHFNDVLSAFATTDFYRMYVEKDPETGESSLMFEMTDKIPEGIPLYIGDIIHNLRVALDHVAHELVRLSGGTPSTRTCFPCGKTREECEKAIRNRAVEGVSSEIVTLIQDVIQPYGGGNNPQLYALHHLDIVDKHRLVLPVFFGSALVIAEATIRRTTRLTNCRAGCWPGGKTCVLRVPGDIKVQGNPQTTLMVAFQNVEFFEGQPVIPTLHQLSQLVSGVIQQITEKYLARS